MREVQQAADDGSARARLALDVFVRRAAAGIAVAAVALPRLDALVFTGGIGENADSIRAQITGRLVTLGVPGVSAKAASEDAVLATSGSGISVLRIEAREDVIMAEAAAAALES